ncbi:cytochrome b/b6 domain-containing protein [Mucilaginibacter xinganensis]|uniref:cytochrome b/b6 domain-containing protein n=1 Tax=Mucilaginibacter xinganensis TaxID=1234841 RepID=UPI0026A471DD
MANKYLHIPRLRRVYVWELPVRFYHWLNALVIIVLIITGFYISNPLGLLSHNDASHQYIMGWFRSAFCGSLHFLF